MAAHSHFLKFPDFYLSIQKYEMNMVRDTVAHTFKGLFQLFHLFTNLKGYFQIEKETEGSFQRRATCCQDDLCNPIESE